jgi:hypothetical protein
MRQRKIEEFNFFFQEAISALELEITRAKASFCFLFITLTPPYKKDVFSCKRKAWEWGVAPVHTTPIQDFSFLHFSHL